MSNSNPPPLPPPIISAPIIPPLIQPVSASTVPSLWFYRFWCALFVGLYMAIAISEVLVARKIMEPDLGLIEGFVAKRDPEFKAALIAQKREDAEGVIVMCVLLAGFFGIAAAVPRKPWGWVVGVIALAGTIFPFVITAAGAIPLLMAWAKPEMKRAFGRRA